MRADHPSTEDKLTALHAQLVAAVADPVHSQAWAQMLTVAARFTTYSPSNVLLIAAQRPDASQVAGIRTWNGLGWHVRKGEHGIAILAPWLYRTDEQASANPEPPPDPGPAGLPRAQLRGFRVVHVFDVTQTEGAPLPHVQPARLTGTAPEHLWDRLTDLVAREGYRLERRTCPAGINGWTAPQEKVVVLDDGLEPAQAAKTLAHELGHIRANHARRFPDYVADRTCRGAAEVEAESIAYILTTHLGMSVEAYSVPYLAGWAHDLDVLRHHMSTVVTVAQGLVHDLEASRTGVPDAPIGRTQTQLTAAPAAVPSAGGATTWPTPASSPRAGR